MKDWFVLPPNNVINNCLASYLDSNIADGSRAGEFFNTIDPKATLIRAGVFDG